MKRRQRSELRESLVTTFVERLGTVIEHEIESRTRVLAAEWLEAALAAAPADPSLIRRAKPAPLTHAPPDAFPPEATAVTASMDAADRPPAAAPARRPRLRTRPGPSSTLRHGATPPAPLSPEQERRDAELARLRFLLKPTGDDEASGAGHTRSVEADVTVVEPPADPLRLLEAEVRSQAHGLAQLPQAGCTARIAAWAGRVRFYEEAHGNRVAADLLLDKLRVLARAMDAGRIEALNGAWRTRDWPFYIRTNEALAETPAQGSGTLAESMPARGSDPDYHDVWSQPS